MPGRILIIDDEPQITRVLRAALSAQGYDVRTANDPEEGLQVYKEWAPDLVITDLMMPGMSGVEVTRAIRARASTPVLCSPFATTSAPRSRHWTPAPTTT
jgi:two-component system KDP operon response regulator KdpE